MENILTPNEAAKVAGVRLQTIYSWIKRGVQGKKLPAKKKQGRVIIKKADLDRFIQDTTQNF